MKPLRIAVIGHGNIGKHHLRILRKHPLVEVCAVIDHATTSFAGPEPFFNSLEEFLAGSQMDAAVVATPISTHFELTRRLLSNGVHVLVEKPITAKPEQARELVQLALEHQRVLAVGHSERYNPAFQVFLEQFRSDITGSLYRVECNRTGPFPQRVGDAGATIDLAVHDLDALCQVTNQKPQWFFAHCEQRIHHHHEDGINAMMGYANGLLIQLTVNWLSPRKNRFFNAYGHRGMLQCNFFEQKVTFFENLHQRNRPDEYGLNGIEVGPEHSFAVSSHEPLQLQWEDFLQRVQNGNCDYQGLDCACSAVEMAEHLLRSAREGKVLPW